MGGLSRRSDAVDGGRSLPASKDRLAVAQLDGPNLVDDPRKLSTLDASPLLRFNRHRQKHPGGGRRLLSEEDLSGRGPARTTTATPA
jgi:hypothetical protein